MALQTRPEPMNASPHHSKVRVSLTLGQSIIVAGGHIAGKMEVECRADKGLGVGVIMVELLGIEELTSRDHSATSTFIHSRRLFQGPGLPPSNAVQPYSFAGDPTIPRDHYQARRGLSTFLFRFPVPFSSPSAISFGSGLACVRYEIRGSVGVAWKGENRLVTDKKGFDVVESYEEELAKVEPEGVIIGENGKIWIQGRLVGGVIVSGESACVELQVKNHSNKKNTGLTITLTRMLHLPGVSELQESPLQISDTLTTVAFRGPEYIVQPGTEGVASLVFDVPQSARSVKGGIRDGDEEDARTTEALFEVRCIVGIKMVMGIGSKDINLDLLVTIVHPSAIPRLPILEQYPLPSPHLYPSPIPNAMVPHPAITPTPFLDRVQSPFVLPTSPPLQPFIHQGHVWLPPPTPQLHDPHHDLSVPFPIQQHCLPVPGLLSAVSNHPRPSSAGAFAPGQYAVSVPQHLVPLDYDAQQIAEPEEGKGVRASRISQHLHLSSRNRSVSPQSHRFPLSVSQSSPMAIPPSATFNHLLLTPDIPDATSLNIATQSQGVVLSPRPLSSPKQSFSVDHATHSSIPKSMRVEELERMAEELNSQNGDLSGDIPKIPPEFPLYSDKTLPAPPVPTSKPRFQLQVTSRTPRPIINKLPDPVDAAKTPPTPTLTAITAFKQPQNDGGPRRAESGLDALERRLLAEVGTRKLDAGSRRPHVGVVLPIGIPQSNKEIEQLHDSAISSLTLAEHDSDERTQRAGKSSVSGDDREFPERGRGQRLPVYPSSRSETERGNIGGSQPKKGKKKDQGNDSDAHRIRKLAKGRVAAWLGRIDPDVPPEMPPSPDMTESPSGESDRPELLADRARDVVTFSPPEPPPHPFQENSSAPNPRSSGFVPIKTAQEGSFARHAVLEPANKPVTKPRFPTDAIPKPVLFPAAAIPQTLRTNRAVSPPSSQDVVVDDEFKLTQMRLKSVSTKVNPIVSKSPVKVSPRVAFPPALSNPEVKYDIKSARGGRGGKVTAVAAIWKNAAAQDISTGVKPKSGNDYSPTKSKPQWTPPKLTTPLSGRTKQIDPPGNPLRPVVKSMSVPAVVSSSHATPTLSSTASLARVTTTSSSQPITVPPYLASPAKTMEVRSPAGELAFGQARLRDLIKKYQGQAS